ncbi:MAG: hypothetical protein NC299_17930 [Lachnospiraceae bacterium]|nr:hypothetical protein [Ruminococcus sp.]MCM1277208.1 hypothetical protein [Lachnospiraceae bacterium]
MTHRIVKAEFTSVWDDGVKITTDCKVNLETKEVFDIKVAEEGIDDLDILVKQYVTINGEDFEVSDDPDLTEYWYN